MKLPDDILMAYADGELEGPQRMDVEAALAADPDLARRVSAHRSLRASLAASYDSVLKEPVPDRLTSLLGPASGRVLPFRRKAASRGPLLQRGSLAASFVLGALVWFFASRLYSSGPITDRNGELVASGALARALSNQLAADQSSSTPVQIGVSFLSTKGNYCRTFQLQDTAAVAGLACRRDAQWKLEVLAHTPAMTAHQQYRQAASALPPAVLQAVSDSISGDPLDATAEGQARAQSWQGRH